MILLDTGPVVALCNPLDELRSKVTADFCDLDEGPFCLCDAVLVEACYHLRADWQRLRLRELLGELRVSIQPGTSDPAFVAEVFDWLAKYAEHAPDWTDACIAVLSGRDRKLKVWTYDSEFRTVWRRPDGTAIPLANRA